MKPFHRAALVLTTSLAVLAPMPAFGAIGTTHRDAVGDVVSFSEDSDSATPQPGRAEGDIRGISASHRKKVVVVSVRLRELSRRPELSATQLRLNSNKGRRDVTVVPIPGTSRSVAEVQGPRGTVKCKVNSKVSFVNNSVRVAVPRKCLGNPRWVRVGAGIISVEEPNYFLDDAYRNVGVGDELRLGPRLTR